MAVSTSKYPNERMRFWFSSRVAGSGPQTPLGELQRKYWYSLGLNGTFDEQQRTWLKKIITDAGKTPGAVNRVAQLLIEALDSQGIVPSKFESENWQKLFSQYNP